MPELGSLGSVRGALSNERPYRDLRYAEGKFISLTSRPNSDLRDTAQTTAVFREDNHSLPGTFSRGGCYFDAHLLKSLSLCSEAPQGIAVDHVVKAASSERGRNVRRTTGEEEANDATGSV